MVTIDIYTTTTCPYCIRAKALLIKKGLNFNEIRVDAKPALRTEMIQRSSGRTSVPQIFIANIHVGGCDELFALESNDQLDSLLAS